MDKEWISTKEAAALLRISRSRLYQIKYRLTHRKGPTQQSRLMFLKDTLVDDYCRYSS